MTIEEIAKELKNVSLETIATGLLDLEAVRKHFQKCMGETTKNNSLELSDEERRKQVGARVRMMRQLLGLTQADLAKKIGVTNQAIATYEKGKREATYKNLIGLSRALGVTTDWLLGEPPHKREFQLQ